MDKLIITVAPGAPQSFLHEYPDLPRTPQQMADEIVQAWEAGAAIAHFHVWDEAGRPTQELDGFRQTIALVRERCDILIEGSTGGLTGFSAADRCVALQTDIEMASLNPGSVNYDEGVYINSPADIDYWTKEMHQRGIKPSIAIFDTGMIANTLPYLDDGTIAQPPLFNFVVGQTGAIPATARHVMFLIESLPPGSLWEITGHSGHDLEAALWSVAFGGHARAGFEDNIYYRPGDRATSNAQLIERIVRLAREAEREIASPAEARVMLGLG
jgi:3-keto-5-aminohexanoate cleavage enzyme